MKGEGLCAMMQGDGEAQAVMGQRLCVMVERDGIGTGDNRTWAMCGSSLWERNRR